MAKQKRIRIEAVKHFPNVSHHASTLKGRWSEIFQNENPITLELGCGKGDYTLTLAQKNPERNFIGIDLKGYRLWKAASHAIEQNIKNVYFLRANVLDLGEVFEPESISEIWITFPDPYPKKPRKRMTAERYLDVYKKIGAPGCFINFKTDDDAFYLSSLESLTDYGCIVHQNITDVHGSDGIDERLKILTYYERQHLQAGLKIKYLQFSLPQEV